jgi:hypothetical protein
VEILQPSLRRRIPRFSRAGLRALDASTPYDDAHCYLHSMECEVGTARRGDVAIRLDGDVDRPRQPRESAGSR